MLLTGAIVIAEEVQRALVVMSVEVPSLKVPVNLICRVDPLKTVAGDGVAASEVNAITNRTVEPLTAPDVAVIWVKPSPLLVANPSVPAVLLMVAVTGFEETQVTEVVRSRVLPSA